MTPEDEYLTSNIARYWDKDLILEVLQGHNKGIPAVNPEAMGPLREAYRRKKRWGMKRADVVKVVTINHLGDGYYQVLLGEWSLGDLYTLPEARREARHQAYVYKAVLCDNTRR